MMITEKIIDFLFLIVEKILSILPSVSYSSSISQMNQSVFWQYVQMVAYLIPLRAVAPIVVLIISFSFFRLAVSIVRTVWDLLPFV